MDISERIKLIRGDLIQEKFAERIGVKKNTVGRFERGEQRPGFEEMNAILDCYPDINPAWLLLGEGSMMRGENASGVKEDESDYSSATCSKCGEKAINDDFLLVPRYNVQAAAGHGTEVANEQVVDHLAFKRQWVKSLGLQSDKLALITAKGDSMEPTIKDGSLLLVDTRSNPLSDGIYVLKFDGLLMAKRLTKNPIDQAVTIQSDNNSYPPFTARHDQVRMLDVVGRVVWIGQKAS